MKYLIIAAIIALIVFIVLTRSVSSLQLENGRTLLLKVDKHTIRLDTHSVGQKQLDFRTVTLSQTILKDKDGSLLVFEHAFTDDLYQFDHRSTQQTMKMIFDSQQVVTVYQRNNLAFYQVSLDGEDVINLIVHQSGDQVLSLAYGFGNVKFTQILKEIEPSHTAKAAKLQNSATVISNPEKAVKTKWSTVLNTIDSLIVPLDSSS